MALTEDTCTKTYKSEADFINAIITYASRQDKSFPVELTTNIKRDAQKAAANDDYQYYGEINLRFPTSTYPGKNDATNRNVTIYQTTGYFESDDECHDDASNILERIANTLEQQNPPIRTERIFSTLTVYSAKKDLKDRLNNNNHAE